MPDVTIRYLSEETYRTLQVRAAEHARSVEAEILFILEEVVRPKDRVKIGTELAAFGRQIGGH
jgi:plasmid stability protein